MTHEEFQALPLLLRRYHLLKAGISRKDIPKLVASGELEIYSVKANSKRYFTKQSVARLVALPNQNQGNP